MESLCSETDRNQTHSTLQAVLSRRPSYGSPEPHPAGAVVRRSVGGPSPAGQLGREQDRRVRGLHVPGIHAAAVQLGVWHKPRYSHWQWHQLPCWARQLRLWAPRALHIHRHGVLVLSRRRRPCTQGEFPLSSWTSCMARNF